jgi:MoxR-like ATPase
MTMPPELPMSPPLILPAQNAEPKPSATLSAAFAGAPAGTVQAITGDALHARIEAIRGQIGLAFVGQVQVLDQLLIALLAGGHVLLEGVPGLGKTLLVRALSCALDCAFSRIQFTPDLMPSDVSGHSFYDPKTETFKIRRGPVFTNLLLADEINRAPAKTQSALLEVMQEQQVTIESRSFSLSPPFMTVATQNPVEQEGTYPLPEAQLDRFLLKILMQYPSLGDEVNMVSAVTLGRASAEFDLARVRAVAKPEDILAMQLGVAAVRVDPVVLDYAVRVARATREYSGIALGAGPRGGLAIVRAARAHAVLERRDFVTPDDVRAVAKPALRHRVSLSPEMQIEGRDVDAVLDLMLAKVEAPRR